MKLAGKLFFSYIVVALVGLAVLSISTAFVAPANFSRQMHMRGSGAGMMQQRMAALDAELEASFRESLVNALALAGIAAVVAAAAISWLVSRRIVSPIQALADLSRRIAGGHYEQRLRLDTDDELAELVESFNQMAASLAETETMRQQL
jgi:methyl-accepting chemotaxis protein